MMYGGALERSSNIDRNKRWREVERRGKCCFPRPGSKYLIWVLRVDKVHDSAEAPYGLSEISNLKIRNNFLVFKLSPNLNLTNIPAVL